MKLNWDWTFEDLDCEAQRFRKVSQFSQSALPSKALYHLTGFGLAVGVEVLHDLALTMRHAKEPIKRPQKYVEASIRKWCEERTVDRESVLAIVEEVLRVAIDEREFDRINQRSSSVKCEPNRFNQLDPWLSAIGNAN